jgi:DNA-binding transcriptional LysR family regulator
MDRLQELAVLVAVIDHGSLAAAARRLRRSAPAVTRALAALKHRIGARLVERSTRRLSVTEAGRAFGERARALLNEYDVAFSRLADTPLSGLLRVIAPLQFGRRHVAPLVIGFLESFREMQVELILNDRNLDLIEEGMLCGLARSRIPVSLPSELERCAESSSQAPLILQSAARQRSPQILRLTTRFLELQGRSLPNGASGLRNARRSCGCRRGSSSMKRRRDLLR